MTTEELVTLIELRHKLKREISEEEFQDIKPLKTDPAIYDIDVVNEKIVKRYTSHIMFSDSDVEYYCERFINNLKKKGYNIKSFKYLDEDGYVLLYGDPRIAAQQFSVVFTNPK